MITAMQLRAARALLGIDQRALAEAGYVEIKKGFRARKPLTRIRITTKGRAASTGYLDAIGKLIGN